MCTYVIYHSVSVYKLAASIYWFIRRAEIPVLVDGTRHWRIAKLLLDVCTDLVLETEVLLYTPRWFREDTVQRLLTTILPELSLTFRYPKSRQQVLYWRGAAILQCLSHKPMVVCLQRLVHPSTDFF